MLFWLSVAVVLFVLLFFTKIRMAAGLEAAGRR